MRTTQTVGGAHFFLSEIMRVGLLHNLKVMFKGEMLMRIVQYSLF